MKTQPKHLAPSKVRPRVRPLARSTSVPTSIPSPTPTPVPPPKYKYRTREEWLQAATTLFRRRFTTRTPDLTLPPAVHVSVGFPSTRALSAKNRREGECWFGAASKDGHPHVFISPLKEDAVTVLGILLHELVHAAGVHGHRASFKKPAEALGLTGPMTSSVPGEELAKELAALVAEGGKLGPYPHHHLTPGDRPTKKQSTRLLKAGCECGAIIRLSRKVADDPGLPTCACGGEFVLEDGNGVEDEDGD